jgi:peroxiredoxin Q/BCP
MNRFAELLALCAAAGALASCNGPIRTEEAAPAAPAVVKEENRALKPAKDPLEVGDPIPDFTLQDQAGRSVSTAELLSGKGAVLVFMPPADSSASRPAYAWARQHASILQQRGLELLLVRPESVAQNAQTAQLEELRLAVLSDPSSWVASAFGFAAPRRAPGRLYTVVLGGDGRLQYVTPGLGDPAQMVMAAETRPGASQGSLMDVFR